MLSIILFAIWISAFCLSASPVLMLPVRFLEWRDLTFMSLLYIERFCDQLTDVKDVFSLLFMKAMHAVTFAISLVQIPPNSSVLPRQEMLVVHPAGNINKPSNVQFSVSTGRYLQLKSWR